VRCAVNGRCTLAGDVVEAVCIVVLHQLVEDQVRIGYVASAPIEHIRGDDSIAPRPTRWRAPFRAMLASRLTACLRETPTLNICPCH
jgi:hypothetical protein